MLISDRLMTIDSGYKSYVKPRTRIGHTQQREAESTHQYLHSVPHYAAKRCNTALRIWRLSERNQEYHMNVCSVRKKSRTEGLSYNIKKTQFRNNSVRGHVIMDFSVVFRYESSLTALHIMKCYKQLNCVYTYIITCHRH
ncbi:unnamed protein product [Meganyctiphanes norvegica]|uniref:Uncharacterized protein n=1 Tax=Meganyctiphanes norvegica TaxID=48144 RepID=A0AAV2QW03_MEGNR